MKRLFDLRVYIRLDLNYNILSVYIIYYKRTYNISLTYLFYNELKDRRFVRGDFFKYKFGGIELLNNVNRIGYKTYFKSFKIVKKLKDLNSLYFYNMILSFTT